MWLILPIVIVIGLIMVGTSKKLTATSAINSAKVFHRERAVGVHPKLIAFLDWWDIHGTFPVTIGINGGIRTDESWQRNLFEQGRTKPGEIATGAATLSETPHGRGGALDLWPTINGKLDFTNWNYYDAIGAAAEAFGLNWGGNFSTVKDGAHVELVNWRNLAYPPKPFVGSEVA